MANDIITRMKDLSSAVSETTTFDRDRLIEVFSQYFINGEGAVFNPISEDRPNKPVRKMVAFLEECGFEIIDCFLEQTDYHVKIVTGYGDNFDWDTVIIDYWNANVYWAFFPY